MQTLPQGVTTAAELRAHYKRTAKNIIRPKPVLIVDNSPEPILVPVFYVQPRIVYFKQPSPYSGDCALHLPKMHEIAEVVCEFYRCTRLDLISERRNAEIVRPRQVVMYLSRKMTTKSLPEIGKFLGGKDHTTVLSGVRKIERLLSSNEGIRKEVGLLSARVKELVTSRRVLRQ